MLICGLLSQNPGPLPLRSFLDINQDYPIKKSHFRKGRFGWNKWIIISLLFLFKIFIIIWFGKVLVTSFMNDLYDEKSTYADSIIGLRSQNIALHLALTQCKRIRLLRQNLRKSEERCWRLSLASCLPLWPWINFIKHSFLMVVPKS